MILRRQGALDEQTDSLLVSFFNDFTPDIVIPRIPILFATILAAGPVALGLIEDVADAFCFLKLWSGRYSDAMRGRRKRLALAADATPVHMGIYGLSSCAG